MWNIFKFLKEKISLLLSKNWLSNRKKIEEIATDLYKSNWKLVKVKVKDKLERERHLAIYLYPYIAGFPCSTVPSVTLSLLEITKKKHPNFIYYCSNYEQYLNSLQRSRESKKSSYKSSTQRKRNYSKDKSRLSSSCFGSSSSSIYSDEHIYDEPDSQFYQNFPSSRRNNARYKLSNSCASTLVTNIDEEEGSENVSPSPASSYKFFPYEEWKYFKAKSSLVSSPHSTSSLATNISEHDYENAQDLIHNNFPRPITLIHRPRFSCFSSNTPLISRKANKHPPLSESFNGSLF